MELSYIFTASGRSAAWFSAPAWGAGGRRFKSRRPDIFLLLGLTSPPPAAKLSEPPRLSRCARRRLCLLPGLGTRPLHEQSPWSLPLMLAVLAGGILFLVEWFRVNPFD